MKGDPFAPRAWGPPPAPGVPVALCLHGFTGAPADMDPVAEALALCGYSGRTPRLAGHDGTVLSLRPVRRAEWRAQVGAEAADLARQSGRPVLACGLSMGALLALDLAIAGSVAVSGVASLAVALDLGPGARAAALLGRTARGAGLAWPKRGGPDIEREVELPNTRAVPLGALAEVVRLAREVSSRLGGIQAPLLVVHAQEDHTARLTGALELFSGAASRQKRLVVLTQGYHVITRDHCATRVAVEVARLAQLLA